MIIMAIPGNYIPSNTSLWDLFQEDKLVHIALFSAFAFSWIKHLNKKSKEFYKTVLIVLIFGTVYAILTEVLQRFVFIGRNANISDVIADIIGLLLGTLFFTKGKINNLA